MFRGISLETNIIIFGVRGAGKTKLKERLCGKAFSETYLPTSGLDFSSTFPKDPEDAFRSINLRIGDTAGDCVMAKVKPYFSDTDAIVYVIDPTTYLGKQFEKIFQNLAYVKPKTQLNIVINKADTLEEDDRKCLEAIVNNFIKNTAASFKKLMFNLHIVSAKNENDTGVKDLLKTILIQKKKAIQNSAVQSNSPVQYARIFQTRMVLPPPPRYSLPPDKKPKLV